MEGEAGAADLAPRPEPARASCHACRRRVPLTAMPCRCTHTFCRRHEAPCDHGCSFDYRAFGRSQVAGQNPRVVADKIASG